MNEEMPYTRPIWNWHSRKILQEAVKIAQLKAEEEILDFGCYIQELKKYLPKDCYYNGYDQNKQYSEMEDYTTKENIGTVFALNVLEHIPQKGLDQTLRTIKYMGVKKIIIAQSAENILCKTAAFVSNRDAYIDINHLLTTRQVFKTMHEHFGLPEEYKRINLTHYIARYELKEEE